MLRLRGLCAHIDFRLGAAVGRPLLHKAVGDDARFADHHQFTLIRDSELGWLVEAAVTRNPTCLRGKLIPSGVPQILADGDELTVGGTKARLLVEIIRGGT